MSSTLAIISLACSALVAPTVVAGYALYRQQLERQTEVENELRAVLDNAAEKLEAVLLANEQLDTLWRSGVAPDEETGQRARSERTRAILSARVARDRIAIRIPAETLVYKTFDEGLNAADAYAKLLRGFLRREACDAGALAQTRDTLVAAQLSFTSAARDQVGVHRSYRWPSPLWPTLPLPPGRTK